MKKPAHRPRREYPEAPIHRSHVALEECPFCGGQLISTCSREVDKYVQTLKGPVHVIGYSRKCNNADCPQPQARYHATWGAKLSLPNSTYGLDVLAYIAYRHDGEQKQFKEIWQELETEYRIEICEREVGRLYRKIEALLMGNQAAIQQELAATVHEYGQLIMAVDALEPDGGGPKLYILHEILSNTVISVAMVDQANGTNLTEWLAPYKEWGWAVKATLSDNEKALVIALKTTWPSAVHQLCQMHFVKNLSEPLHEADRELQKTMRDGMGQLPSVPRPKQEPEEEVEAALQADDSSSNEEEVVSVHQPSAAVMQVIDIISGVELETLDSVVPEEWERLLMGQAREIESRPDAESASQAKAKPVLLFCSDLVGAEAGQMLTAVYMSVSETVTWINQTLLAQVPASARPLVVAVPDSEAVTYWEHIWYRRAIQDTRHLGSRKPFQCGGLRGYDQLQSIAEHLAARQAEQGLDSYLSKLQVCVQQAVEQARPLADDVRQAQGWIVRIERLLADEPVTDGTQPASAIQRQHMLDLLVECEGQEDVGPTVHAVRRTWRRMLDSWGDDLYHCYDIEGLPRSNLGIEALFGQARRQQRRLQGQADTSPLAVTGQGYLRSASASQEALLEIFCQVPTWVYRLALRCVEAVEAGVRWPRQLHRNTPEALRRFQAQAETLRQRIAAAKSTT